MILFFNTKIDNQISSMFESNLWGCTPIMYPRNCENTVEINKLEILKYTLETYALLNFKKIYLNIILPENREEQNFESFLKSNFNGKKFTYNKYRPSNYYEWSIEIKKLIDENGEDELCLTAMNHDHPFVSNSKIFNEVIKDLIELKIENKVLVYSHSAEYISKIYKNKKNIKRRYGYLLKNTTYTESIMICSLKVLKSIFEQIIIIKEKQYLPRIDWPDLIYNKKKYNLYVPMIELFKHYDGYGHISTCSFSKGLNINNNYHSSNIVDRISDQWWSLLFLTIRDADLSNNKIKEQFKIIFNKSIDTFINSHSLYIEEKNKINIDEFSYLIRSAICSKLNKNMREILFDKKFSKITLKTKIINIIWLIKLEIIKLKNKLIK
jgi:hypothetical protein